jgi:hypothetical protein
LKAPAGAAFQILPCDFNSWPAFLRALRQALDAALAKMLKSLFFAGPFMPWRDELLFRHALQIPSLGFSTT